MVEALRKRLNAVFFFILGAAAAVVLTVGNNWLPASIGAETKQPVKLEAAEKPQIDAKSLELAAGLSKAFGQVASAVSPSVVHIATSKTIKTRPDMNTPFEDDFFERFFGRRIPREYRQNALGSGIIVSADGYILTNNHVVSDADELKVKLSDDREFTAKLIGTDPESEVAVIKIEGENLPAAALGDSDKLAVGQWVIAIGNPFGFDRTVTQGIVSATGRSLGMQAYEDYIQTDAAINPGNSGGPLVNLAGEVVGVNTVIISRTGGYQGLGFAIPINMARSVMESLINNGKMVRGFLGVQPQDIDENLAKALELGNRVGSLVADVVKGSSAEKAGIKHGDVILTFDGQKVRDAKHLRELVARTAVGKEVEILLNRKGKEMTLTASISDRAQNLPTVGAVTREDSTESLGMTVESNTPENRQELGVKETEGVIVSDVQPGSPADKKGIKPGAVILEVRQQAVNSVGEYSKLIRESDLKQGVLLLVSQGGVNQYIVLKAD